MEILVTLYYIFQAGCQLNRNPKNERKDPNNKISNENEDIRMHISKTQRLLGNRWKIQKNYSKLFQNLDVGQFPDT